MIDFVSGIVSSQGSDSVTILTDAGIGLAVLVPDPNEFPISAEVRAYTVLLLSGAAAGDGEFKLYGFSSKQDRVMFQLLKSVGGVGGKAALTILGAHGLRGVVDAISHNEPDALRVKGVGPKITQKIVADLQKKVAQAFGA